MFFLQVLISFAVVITVLLLALMVHWVVNKRRILTNLRSLESGLDGRALAEGLLAYPRFEGAYRGRAVALSFRSTDGDGPRLTYQVITVAARTDITLLLLKTNFFKPAQSEALTALREAGGATETISGEADGPYHVRSGDPGRALALYRHADFQGPLAGLAHTVGLVLGPDNLVASIPYTDVAETDPGRVMSTIESLAALAAVMERPPA